MEGLRYAYSCREDDSIVPIHRRIGGFEGFVVELRFCKKIEKAANRDDFGGGGGGDDALLLKSYRKFFDLPNLASYDENHMELMLCGSLFEANIPKRVMNSIIDDALSFARRMWNEAYKKKNKMKKKKKETSPSTGLLASNLYWRTRAVRSGIGKERGREKKKKVILPIVVDIVVRTWQSPFESEKEAIARALNESLDATIGDAFIPPCEGRRERMEAIDKEEAAAASFNAAARAAAITRPSVQSLEYVKLDNNLSLEFEFCDLCMRRLKVGMVVTRMPCSHTFHADCILHQLMRCSLCPACHPLTIVDVQEILDSML